MSFAQIRSRNTRARNTGTEWNNVEESVVRKKGKQQERREGRHGEKLSRGGLVPTAGVSTLCPSISPFSFLPLPIFHCGSILSTGDLIPDQ
jgi:hypothetical protein